VEQNSSKSPRSELRVHSAVMHPTKLNQTNIVPSSARILITLIDLSSSAGSG